MSDVTYGISPECLCHDVRDNVERVRALEDAGFQYIWEGDHTLPWQHSAGHSSGIFTTLTAFLSRTERAVVGGMVIPAIGIRHHPIDVAVEIATQALLYPGRVALCVGTGEAMNEKTTTGFWPPLRERIERCVEGIELIKKAWESDDYFQSRRQALQELLLPVHQARRADPARVRCPGPDHGAGTPASTPTVTSRWEYRRRTIVTC